LDIQSVLGDNPYFWQQFLKKEELSPQQEKQFADYLLLLIEWSEKINLTTITTPSAVVKYHFQDSLYVNRSIDFSAIKTICDVGTGGGFPALPLKIKYPHLRVILIEVNNKKINFLEEVIAKLGLENVEIYPEDWRTFLRKTDDTIDLFFSRASLHTDELIRMFKPSSPYKDAQLIYWAATQWEPTKFEKVFVKKEVAYSIGQKKRKLVFFAQ
jgi:16S rRNA (guanine(527)-N(7))-methyltransferase RsmG